jgi:hypothetical protein
MSEMNKVISPAIDKGRTLPTYTFLTPFVSSQSGQTIYRGSQSQLQVLDIHNDI